jgi:hypothetical protein
MIAHEALQNAVVEREGFTASHHAGITYSSFKQERSIINSLK